MINGLIRNHSIISSAHSYTRNTLPLTLNGSTNSGTESQHVLHVVWKPEALAKLCFFSLLVLVPVSFHTI